MGYAFSFENRTVNIKGGFYVYYGSTHIKGKAAGRNDSFNGVVNEDYLVTCGINFFQQMKSAFFVVGKYTVNSINGVFVCPLNRHDKFFGTKHLANQ